MVGQADSCWFVDISTVVVSDVFALTHSSGQPMLSGSPITKSKHSTGQMGLVCSVEVDVLMVVGEDVLMVVGEVVVFKVVVSKQSTGQPEGC